VRGRWRDAVLDSTDPSQSRLAWFSLELRRA